MAKKPDFVVNKVKVFDDGRLLVYGGRLSYEHVFDKYAKKGSDDTPRWGGTLILDKDLHGDAIDKINSILVARQKEVFKKKLKKDALCFRDGDDSGKEEYENAMILVASETKNRPTVIGKKKEQVLKEDGKVYSGCYINMMVSLWDQKSQEWGDRINANLLAVQLVADGEAFTSGPSVDVDEDFDVVEGDDDEDDGFGD